MTQKDNKNDCFWLSLIKKKKKEEEEKKKHFSKARLIYNWILSKEQTYRKEMKIVKAVIKHHVGKPE